MNQTNKDGTGQGLMAAWKVCVFAPALHCFMRLYSLRGAFGALDSIALETALMVAFTTGRDDCEGVREAGRLI